MDAENWTRACSILSLFLSKFDTVWGFSHLDVPSTYCMTYWKRAYVRHLWQFRFFAKLILVTVIREITHNPVFQFYESILSEKNYLSIFLYVLTPEGDIRRVPVNEVLGVSFFFFVFVFFYCAMLVVLVVSERSQCLPYNAERQAR